jgi:pimeloyl-ACP methyl ester carboxylesterase
MRTSTAKKGATKMKLAMIPAGVVRRMSLQLCIVLLLLSCCVLSAQNNNNQHQIRNIVLVHGAWVDGSGWKGVYEILVRDGYQVSLVQEPLTAFADDLTATKRVLTEQQGPCILVAHSYGGSLITEAGNEPQVVGLVYVAAHMPDAGESEAQEGKLFPSAVSTANVITKTPDGFTFLEPSEFQRYFAADLPREQALFEAHSQIQTAAAVFTGVITTPAWKAKPSWMIIPSLDMIISPKLERFYAERAHSHITELAGASHSVYESRAKEVAAVIEEAAKHAQSDVGK